jgi:hypothetical protein
MDSKRMNEIMEYVQADVARRETVGAAGGEVHIHYHAAPVVIDPAPVNQNPGQSVLDKYTPYFLVLLGGTIILAIVALVLVLLAPVLMAIMATVVGSLLAVGVVAIAISGSLRNVKQASMDEKIVNAALKRTRRR